MTYRTLREIRTIDPSLRNLRWARSCREAGWTDWRAPRKPRCGLFWVGYAVFLVIVVGWIIK